MQLAHVLDCVMFTLTIIIIVTVASMQKHIMFTQAKPPLHHLLITPAMHCMQLLLLWLIGT